MKFRAAVAASTLALATVTSMFLGTAVAEAAPAPTAKIQQVRLLDSGYTAQVQVLYKCFGGNVADGAHLWVSVKQGKYPEKEGSGERASTHSWYDDHPDVHCDGAYHTGRFNLPLHGDKVPATTDKKIWVQWCLFESDGTPLFVQQFDRIS